MLIRNFAYQKRDSPTLDNSTDIEGYNLVHADHPDNIKRGGVRIYYKESLSV